MIGYVTLGTNDMARAGKFYDALLAEVGGKRQMETERFISWSAGPTSPGIGVIKTVRWQVRDGRQRHDGRADVRLAGEGQVDLRQGAQARREGRRPAGHALGNFYAAYFRDLDGNKLNAFCMTS